MSAIKALKNFLNDVGVDCNNGTAKVYTFPKPIEGDSDGQKFISIFYEDNELKMSVEDNDFLFQTKVGEHIAFVIAKHIYDNDKENGDRLGWTMPDATYEEFEKKIFLESLKNLRSEIETIIAKANLNEPLDNDAWIKPAMAMNMIMNDVRHYNHFVESLAR